VCFVEKFFITHPRDKQPQPFESMKKNNSVSNRKANSKKNKGIHSATFPASPDHWYLPPFHAQHIFTSAFKMSDIYVSETPDAPF
jgi:hypothetical protein